MTEQSNHQTPSEAVLTALCRRTFLRLWSHPNLFRDQGQKQGGDGKEICDLLVVFGDDVIIFSDKSCAYPATGDSTLNWSRWHRRAIVKSADQIFGAERWLASHPSRVFLDRKCTRPFEVPLPPLARRRVHRVVVALNAAEPCRAHFGGGSGSLMLTATETGHAFSVCPMMRDGFVHVFDDVTLGLVLQELDTTADLVHYLAEKEVLFRAGHTLVAPGEEELLALHLADKWKDRTGREYLMRRPRVVEEGLWYRFQSSDEYKRKVEADDGSRIWDMLVEHFTSVVLNRRPALDPFKAELALRALAAHDRLSRRLLAKELAFEKVDPTQGRTRVIRNESAEAILFALPPTPPEVVSAAELQDFRVRYISTYARLLLHHMPEVERVVAIGFAIDDASASLVPDELMLMSQGPLTTEELSHLRATQELMGWQIGRQDAELRMMTESIVPPYAEEAVDSSKGQPPDLPGGDENSE